MSDITRLNTAVAVALAALTLAENETGHVEVKLFGALIAEAREGSMPFYSEYLTEALGYAEALVAIRARQHKAARAAWYTEYQVSRVADRNVVSAGSSEAGAVALAASLI